MAGEHRRTRCDNCKGMFQFGLGSYKVAAVTPGAIEKRVYCSASCAIEGIRKIEGS